MLIIERHRTEGAANRARKFYVKAQKRVDSVMERMWGEPVVPVAEDTYLVIRDGKKYAVAIDDPSAPA